MKEDYTHIAVLVDRSGSMTSIQLDMEGGLNEFIKKQHTDDRQTHVTVVRFDGRDPFEVVVQNSAANLCPHIALEPRGTTPYLDALGKTISHLGQMFNAMDEAYRPSSVIVLVVTDGLENASREYTHEQVGQLIKQQTDEWGWQFIFMGSNMDAVTEGKKMNVPVGTSIEYKADPLGTRHAWDATAQNVRAFSATHDMADLEYTDKQRVDAMAEEKRS